MHQIHYNTYPDDCDRKRVQAELNECAAENDDNPYSSGLDKAIRWLSVPAFKSYDDAKEYIDTNYCGNYEQVAVRYLDYDKTALANRKTLELREKIDMAYKAVREKAERIYAKTVTAEYISCKKCGSRLKRTLVETNRCPLCRNDLRTPTMLKETEVANAKWEKLLNDLKIEEDKLRDKAKKNAKTKWLVKIEFHC